MKDNNYQSSFITASSPEDVIKKISNASGWWSKHFQGHSEKKGDIFTVSFGKEGKGDRYQMEVTEIIPTKIVWKVIDSKQDWVKNHTEWTGTEIIWDISLVENGVQVTLTHKGLTSQLECRQKCEGGWNWLMKESLEKYFSEGKGMPV